MRSIFVHHLLRIDLRHCAPLADVAHAPHLVVVVLLRVVQLDQPALQRGDRTRSAMCVSRWLSAVSGQRRGGQRRVWCRAGQRGGQPQQREDIVGGGAVAIERARRSDGRTTDARTDVEMVSERIEREFADVADKDVSRGVVELEVVRVVLQRDRVRQVRGQLAGRRVAVVHQHLHAP